MNGAYCATGQKRVVFHTGDGVSPALAPFFNASTPVTPSFFFRVCGLFLAKPTKLKNRKQKQ